MNTPNTSTPQVYSAEMKDRARAELDTIDAQIPTLYMALLILIENMGKYVSPAELQATIRQRGLWDSLNLTLSYLQWFAKNPEGLKMSYIISQHPDTSSENTNSAAFMLTPRPADGAEIVLPKYTQPTSIPKTVAPTQRQPKPSRPKPARPTQPVDRSGEGEIVRIYSRPRPLVQPADTEKTQPAAPTSFSISSPVSYKKLPTTFGEEIRERMIIEIQKRYPLSTLYGMVDRYLASKIGEYVHPTELFQAIAEFGYNGTFQDMMTLLTERNDIGSTCSYTVLRPGGKSISPFDSRTPFILVPIHGSARAHVEKDIPKILATRRSSASTLLPAALIDEVLASVKAALAITSAEPESDATLQKPLFKDLRVKNAKPVNPKTPEERLALMDRHFDSWASEFGAYEHGKGILVRDILEIFAEDLRANLAIGDNTSNPKTAEVLRAILIKRLELDEDAQEFLTLDLVQYNLNLALLDTKIAYSYQSTALDRTALFIVVSDKSAASFGLQFNPHYNPRLPMGFIGDVEDDDVIPEEIVESSRPANE